ncbi:MAG: AAA family ATPase, partial [Anaerolineae bacterium]
MLGDKPLTHFRSAKVRGLLIYLALTPQQAHAREVLAALFWPDEPETVAKQNLRQSLFRLRKVLGDVNSQKEPYLLVTRATVQLNSASDHSLDVADFLAALERGESKTAVSHYHGDLLPSFSCDSLPFDNWLRQERERYHRLALDALFTLTSDRLAQANYQSAQTLARQQLQLEPWREEAHRQLIQALALQGERSAALAHYETCRATLAEELGIEPTTETKKLIAHLRHKQTAPTPRQVNRNLRQSRLTIPFIGRNVEFKTLLNAYQRAISEGLQVVMLSGKAGIGKTRLCQQFLEWAVIQGADVLNGRSFETNAGLSYQPLTHLLRQRIERENAPEDLLSDLWLSQLTRLLPELHDRYPDLPQPTQEEATARQHLFEAITRLGQTLAKRQPLVLFVDDWHWADAASLDVLHYAAVRWAEAKTPILLLLTLRQ